MIALRLNGYTTGIRLPGDRARHACRRTHDDRRADLPVDMGTTLALGWVCELHPALPRSAKVGRQPPMVATQVSRHCATAIRRRIYLIKRPLIFQQQHVHRVAAVFVSTQRNALRCVGTTGFRTPAAARHAGIRARRHTGTRASPCLANWEAQSHFMNSRPCAWRRVRAIDCSGRSSACPTARRRAHDMATE